MLRTDSPVPLVAAGVGLIAATYGLVRMAYGLLLPDVQADLGLDVATAGVISAGASVVYCVGALLGFVAAARHTRALVLTATFAASAGALGMALAPGTVVFAVFAIASSAGAGLASPALVAVLQRNASTARSARAQTMVNAGTGPGVIAAGLLALTLAPEWRAAWGIAAILAAALGALVVATDRNDAGAVHEPRGFPTRSWFTAHRRVLAAAALLGAGSAAIWTYGRSFLLDSGSEPLASMLAWIALGTGATAVIATAGRMGRLPPRFAWMITSGTVAVASAAVIAAPVGAVVAFAAFAAFGWGYTAASGVLISWTAQIDPPRAPAGTALLFVMLILGQAVGAAVAGALIPPVGYPAAFLTAALVSAAALLPAWRADRASN